jgi:predicted ATPase/DNA-binding SARP family transcriptional activator
MQVGILGPLSVNDGGAPVDIRGARLRALLIRLALNAGRQVTVDVLADALWDEVPSDRANAVQSLVYRLRRALPDPAVLCRGAGGYGLDLPPDAVDATRFERLAAEGGAALRSGEPEAAAAILGAALDLWRGPALADVTGARYAAAAAARLEELRLCAVEDWLGAGLACGDGRSVLPRLEELVAAQPLRERPVALLVEALYAAGRGAEALAAFDRFRGRLADEVGIDPSPAMRRLHLAVLRGDLRMAARPARRGSLRAPLTSFVGRDTERARLDRQLAGSRLVTLVGPGGVGKTRLAATVGGGWARSSPGGVWLAGLDAATPAAGVAPAVLAAVTGQPSSPPCEPLARLVELLGNGPALLVLDNCEHLPQATAEFADELLGSCPELRILATSREPLGLIGETLCTVPPLDAPPPGATAAEALRYPAVRLFADRAAAVRDGFEVDARTVARVVEICRRLDGLPLAIELAAARLRTLPLARIVAGLDDRFRLLSRGSPAAAPRHRSLGAAVAWSWDLLGREELILARRLAVFPDGFTARAAEEVCAGGLLAAPAVADLLDRLAGRSLLQVDDGDLPRYRMLETVRAYAWERLCAAGEHGLTLAAYAGHCLTAISAGIAG